MPAFFVALRESVHDPKEMRLYADKAAGSAAGHRLVTRVAYGRLRMTEGAPIERAVARVSDIRGSRSLVSQRGLSGGRRASVSWCQIPYVHSAGVE
jgi:hypothetical protein